MARWLAVVILIVAAVGVSFAQTGNSLFPLVSKNKTIYPSKWDSTFISGKPGQWATISVKADSLGATDTLFIACNSDTLDSDRLRILNGEIQTIISNKFYWIKLRPRTGNAHIRINAY
jgi:hypothetical protein